tara:strand:+ start:284 stop:1243 length:960 start_codon:yes stop_codon:yes gene_type:complete
MNLKDKKLLILGGSGFIGTNIIKYYSNKKLQIYATYHSSSPTIKNKNIRWIKIDLLKEDSVKRLLKKNLFDYVIQCAAVTAGVKSMKNEPFKFISGNAVMNSLIIKWCVQYKVKHFIFLSCTVMYPNSNRYLSENEFDIRQKIHPSYEGIAYTKTYIENICNFYSKRSTTKFTALRHSNIYGPFDKFNSDKGHFMASMISKILNKNDILEIWGSGTEKRDFLHIDDFLNGINLIILKQKKNFEIFNLSYGKSFPLKKIIEKILVISKNKKKLKYFKNKPTIKINILVSNKKILNKIGWKPKTTIDEGILKAINWYKSFY